jgi:hypothetical protein
MTSFVLAVNTVLAVGVGTTALATPRSVWVEGLGIKEGADGNGLPVTAIVGADASSRDSSSIKVPVMPLVFAPCFSLRSPNTVGGGPPGETYESNETNVPAGLRGAPSGPANRTFL